MALFTYAASSLVAMIIIAIILGTDIGIGDSWSTPLKNNYELSSTDTPDKWRYMQERRPLQRDTNI